MTQANKIISINNDKYLLRKCQTKLVLHHLPSMDIVHKYYAEVSFFYINQLEIMTLYKNVLTFLKPKCPPLRLIEYQQEYLEWEPVGGLALGSLIILYDKSTIAFYYRSPKVEKSWEIDVVQEIEEVKSSEDELFIALRVKEPRDMIFVWDVGNMSKKPNQQIRSRDQIVKWQFFGKNILLIMTTTQFCIYFPNPKTNQHYIHYYMPLTTSYTSFLTLNDFSATAPGSGVQSINTIAFLQPHSSQFDIIELYDIEKRQRKFRWGQTKTVAVEQDNKEEGLRFNKAIGGYEFEGKVLIVGEKQGKEAKCMVVGKEWQVQKVTEYKQHEGGSLKGLQYEGGYVMGLDADRGKYVLGKFVSHDGQSNVRGPASKIKQIAYYEAELIENAWLTRNYLLFVNKDKKLAFQAISEIQKSSQNNQNNIQPQFSIQLGKYNPKACHLMFQTTDSAWFVCGIRYFRFDYSKRQIVNGGFVLRNQRAKLHQVRKSTYSLLYKISQQYILIEYQPQQQQQKVTFKTITSSQIPKIISLRKQRWAKLTPKAIILGQLQNELCQFSLQEQLYKELQQENAYYDYELFWTTHGGMILAIRNYLFFLQVIDGEYGTEIRLVRDNQKKLLYKRFGSRVNTKENQNGMVTVVDPRNLVVYTGSRIVRLSNFVQHFISENPYSLPDTFLNRQLKMRQYYTPHHYKILMAMLQNGWFTEIGKVLTKVYQWANKFSNENQGDSKLKELYQAIRIQDYWQQIKQIKQTSDEMLGNVQDMLGNVSDNISFSKKVSQVKNQTQNIELFKLLSQHLSQNPQKYHLPQQTHKQFLNILTALMFRQQNPTSFDYFSQIPIVKSRLPEFSGQGFTTMQIAMLKHSINKDEALEFLKSPVEHKMDWDWVKKYSVALWYEDNVEKWKKWVEEIAMNRFRVNKDPFDCLFWYILAGKRNLLITLFKQQKFSSKEHDAMHTFLQRDFQDPKHKTAALKNAYALIDKKRYLHAMAFFLISDKKQQCIRFAIDRLNDLNLAYLIHLLSYGQSKSTFETPNLVSRELIEKGDLWGQHLGWVMEKKYVAGYNVLLKDEGKMKWDYEPRVKGFHTCVREFSERVKNGLGYKREVQEVRVKESEMSMSVPQSFDNYGFQQQGDMPQLEQKPLQTSTLPSTQVKHPQFYTAHQHLFQQTPQQQSNGFLRAQQQKCIKYYMKHHYPCLALTLQSYLQKQQNKQLLSDVTRAYELQKYMLTGVMGDKVKEIAEGLEDVMGLVRDYVGKREYEQLVGVLKQFRKGFELVIRKIKINELNPPQKHQLGQLLHYAYLSEQIFVHIQPSVNSFPKIKQQLTQLTLTNNLGKIICGICLKVYTQMSKSLEGFKQQIFIEAKPQFWSECRDRYETIAEKKKQKHQKLMDLFEFALGGHTKKVKDTQHVDFSVRMPKASTMSVLLWRKILEFMLKDGGREYMREKLKELKVRLDKVVKYWVEEEYIREIQAQVGVLISEGTQYRLKLNILNQQFKQKQLDTIQQLLKVIYTSRDLKQIYQHRRQAKTQPQKSTTDQTPAIEVFKNKSEQMRGFAINKASTKGMEIVVLFKRAMRKFELVDNLVNRDRSKDGLVLIHEDNAYVAEIGELGEKEAVMTKCHIPLIRKSIKGILEAKELNQGQIITTQRQSVSHLVDFFKPIQNIPHIDFTQIHCIASHSTLPIYFLGGKGLIEVCRFDTAKNYNRITCPGLQEIVKMQSKGQRLYVLDKEGNLVCLMMDYRWSCKQVWELKKQGVVDFTCPTSSQIGIVTNNSLQFYDTLLHSKRQCTFKVQMSTPPVSISHLSPTLMVVLRKHQVQVYDISTQQLQQTYNIQGRGRSLHVIPNGQKQGKIIVGRGDCKIKIIDLQKKQQKLVKCGNVHDEKEKVYVESIKSCQGSGFALKNDGVVYWFGV